MIRQFAGGGEPVFQRVLPWAADLERSGSEVAGLPDEFRLGPGPLTDREPAESSAPASGVAERVAPDLTELCVTALKARKRQDADSARAGDGWINMSQAWKRV
jgi:hypothetical protein